MEWWSGGVMEGWSGGGMELQLRPLWLRLPDLGESSVACALRGSGSLCLATKATTGRLEAGRRWRSSVLTHGFGVEHEVRIEEGVGEFLRVVQAAFVKLVERLEIDSIVRGFVTPLPLDGLLV